MTQHIWGDESFDWEGLNKAIKLINKKLRFWRIGIRQSKEKWGRIRIYCSLGWGQLHDITHPGHCFNRYPKWLWSLDCKYFSKIVSFFNFIIIPIHKWVYINAYKKAVKLYPHLKEEICCDADYVKLLSGFYKSRWKEIK